MQTLQVSAVVLLMVACARCTSSWSYWRPTAIDDRSAKEPPSAGKECNCCCFVPYAALRWMVAALILQRLLQILAKHIVFLNTATRVFEASFIRWTAVAAARMLVRIGILMKLGHCTTVGRRLCRS